MENITSEANKGKTGKHPIRNIILLVLALGVAYFGIHAAAVEADRQVRIPQSNCLVLEKTKIDLTEPDLYLIETSCGNYEAIKRMSNYLAVGQEYDMEVTKGNWARNPRLAVAGGCAKPSENSEPKETTVPTPTPEPTEEPTSPEYDGEGWGGNA